MVRNTPEMAAWQAFCRTVGECLGGGVTATATNSGSRITLSIRGCPTYCGGRAQMDITFQTGRLKVTSTSVTLAEPFSSGNIRILRGGAGYPHPHIWNNGTPCWNGATVGRLSDLFKVIVNTVTWANVTSDSRAHGFTDNDVKHSPEFNPAMCRRRIMASLASTAADPGAFYISHFPRHLQEALRGFA